MGDGYDISRGNPRASSVGEKEDVEEVFFRSTSKIDLSETVTIQPCGSSGGSSDPCSQIDLSLHGIMGQEDKFRQSGGTRVNRGGTARIVFSISSEASLQKIDYVTNPQDEDNPTFTNTWTPSTSDKKHHEVFVSVNPSTLYAFKVTVKNSQCPDTNTSGIYYFQTGDVIKLQTCNEVVIEVQGWNSINETMQVTLTEFPTCTITTGSQVGSCTIQRSITLTKITVDDDLTQTIDNSSHIVHKAQIV